MLLVLRLLLLLLVQFRLLHPGHPRPPAPLQLLLPGHPRPWMLLLLLLLRPPFVLLLLLLLVELLRRLMLLLLFVRLRLLLPCGTASPWSLPPRAACGPRRCGGSGCAVALFLTKPCCTEVSSRRTGHPSRDTG